MIMYSIHHYHSSFLLSTFRSILFFCFIIVSNHAIANSFRIALVPSSDSIVYLKTIDSIIGSTNNSSGVSFITVSIEDSANSINSLPDDIDLIVPVGQLALERTVKLYNQTPILSTLISKYDFVKVMRENNIDTKDANIGAVFLDQPIERILDFSQFALPNNNRPGLIFSKDYKNIISNYHKLLSNKKYNIEIYNKNDNLINSLNRVLQSSDVIISLPDTTVFNKRTIHSLLLSTYRKFVPVIAFSHAYVKAGALAGIYSTPELSGKQTGEIIDLITTHNIPIDNLPRQEAKYFEVSVNNIVGRSLGIPALDDAILKNKLLDKENGRND